jgi:hypothetical protein
MMMLLLRSEKSLEFYLCLCIPTQSQEKPRTSIRVTLGSILRSTHNMLADLPQ